jgi:leucyl/phenylalanyl-tRNA--protein transferase
MPVAEAILTPELIRDAYANGWFPMADEGGEMAWYQPQFRALFPIDGIYVSRSLAKRLRKRDFEIRFDTSFEQVIRNCRRPDENWINEEIIRAYTEVHFEGWGHCAECWMDGELVGGVYGVALGSCFSAESMFFRRTDASKIAHLESLGAYEIPTHDYLDRLAVAMGKPTAWSPGIYVSSRK